MDPLPAPFLALIAATIARAWMGYEARARARPQELVAGAGWVAGRSLAGVPLADLAWGLGGLVALLAIIVVGIAKVITR